MKGRVAFLTIGCKVNQCESAALARSFADAGWQVVSGQADLYVINTCTVTAEAERKCRQQIRKLAKANPQAQIVAMGCYAQVAPEELQLPGVKFVVGTTERSDILALLEGAPPRRHVAALGQGLTFEDL